MIPDGIEPDNIEILVVEDSLTQSEDLKYLLESKGYHVTVAPNGKEALERASEKHPTMIITDVVMPEMDGYELCRRIKADSSMQNVPVVLLTSLSRPEDIFRGLGSGADNFIRKPYDRKYLLSRIEYVLANRALRSTERLQVGIELTLGGQRHFIDAQRQQILDLLISTYEEAVVLNETLVRSNHVLDTLYHVAEALNSATSEDDVCEIAVEHASALPGVEAGWISLREGESLFRVVAVRGIEKELVENPETEPVCTCGKLCIEGELDRVIEIHDCPVLARNSKANDTPTHHASIPIWVEGHVLGVMNLIGSEVGGFSEDEQKTLRSVGNQVGIALERARLRSRMQSMVLGRTFALTAEIEQRKAVQASQARLAAILEATTDLVAITDHEGNAIYLNHAGKDLMGVSGNGSGYPFKLSEFLSDVGPDFTIADAYSAASQNGFWRGESTLTSRSGLTSPLSVVVLFHPGRDGENAYYSAIARDISASRAAELKIKTQLERLASLRSIDIAITGSMDLRVALNVLLDQVTGRLGVDAADVLVLNRELNLLEPVASRGFHSPGAGTASIHLGEGLAGRAALERTMVSTGSVLTNDHFTRKTAFADEKFDAYFAVPLVAHGQVRGVLEVYNRSPLDPDREWLDFLEALAGQAAISIDVVRLFDGLQHSNAELTLAYDSTIEGWSHAMDLRDKETEGHTQRVTDLTIRLGRRLGLADPELVHLRRGALLHDIGKMGVPDNILLKPGKLTDEEWVLMRKHPEYAYEMLSSIRYLGTAIDIPYCHHEKWDGSGYPRRLIGQQIPFAARLFAVIDVWDALRSDRPYRPGLSKGETLKVISDGIGSHFDPKIAEEFLEFVEQEKVE
ncbi:MAG TPA: HD domain-containing phosphohydrolase [Spirochaetia bacterium]|nr:HD domain-containing phosphohydrolase [Spirochaetia bacterium]